MAAQPGLKRVLSWVPAALSARTMKAVKGAVFVGSLYELARLAWLAAANGLGANPVELIERGLGTAALVMLLLTLAISPLRWLTGWAWLLRLRRMLGLYAFFYAVLHVTAYVWLDHWFDWQAVWLDIVKRPYLSFGAAAFVLMIPLAVTSTHAWVRRLGGRNWQRLHRWVYLIAALAVLHYWYHKLAKNNIEDPAIYAVILGLLLGARLVHWRNSRQR
ncbi:MAG: protein-methionine-sulfoxide reductase heme-binding subunit MsrQ [Burkholderiaceae bacterium]